jgi:ureidoacrylate peracid hydrolase
MTEMLTTLEERIHIKHTALIVVDMQNDFVHDDGVFAKMGVNLSMFKKIVPQLNGLIDAARNVKVPVIFIQTLHSQWTNSDPWVQRIKGQGEGQESLLPPVCSPGTWGADWFGVKPKEEDYVVTKHRYSAFVNTDLDLVLRSLQRKTVVVTGGETNVCVGSTARSAFMYDYYVILPEDCIAGFDEELHRYGLKILEQYFGMLTTSQKIISIWNRQKGSGLT